MGLQTILGSGGAIGVELAKCLPEYTSEIRLVSRNPQKVNETDQLHSADLTDHDAVVDAVKGSEVVYLTAGFEYDTKVWQKKWPAVMEYVIEACRLHKARLVFFDNVYMYDPSTIGEMTESNPVNPRSRKGKVRARIARMLLDATEKGELEGLIARSADFYGPGKLKISTLTQTVLEPLSKGKKASCLGDVQKLHSFTYTPDAGKAVAILGNTANAFGEVWHLPTSDQKWSMKQFIDYSAGKLDVEPKYQVAGRFLVSLIGIFVPVMRELKEMLYQYEQDYHFVSKKFEDHFDFKVTSYEEGIDQIVSVDYKESQ